MLKPLFLCFALLLVTAGSARAEICRQIHIAQRLEANLAARPLSSDPINNQLTLRALDLNATALTDFYVDDPRLVAAVADYVAWFQHQRTNMATYSLLAHRASLRNMVTASYAFCDNGDQRNRLKPQATDTPDGGMSAPAAVSWGQIDGREFLVIIPLALIIYIIFKRMQARRKRSVRHLCFVDADVTSAIGNFRTKMVDISAIGAKIRLPEGAKLPSKGALSFNGTTHGVNFVWQNNHFAGLQFHRPLRGRIVLALASGKQKRTSKKDRQDTAPSPPA